MQAPPTLHLPSSTSLACPVEAKRCSTSSTAMCLRNASRNVRAIRTNRSFKIETVTKTHFLTPPVNSILPIANKLQPKGDAPTTILTVAPTWTSIEVDFIHSSKCFRVSIRPRQSLGVVVLQLVQALLPLIPLSKFNSNPTAVAVGATQGKTRKKAGLLTTTVTTTSNSSTFKELFQQIWKLVRASPSRPASMHQARIKATRDKVLRSTSSMSITSSTFKTTS